MKREAVVIVFLAASLVCGGTSHAAGLGHWASRGKTIVNKVVNMGGMPDRATSYFTAPAKGGYSPLQKTLAAGLLPWLAGVRGYKQAAALFLS